MAQNLRFYARKASINTDRLTLYSFRRGHATEVADMEDVNLLDLQDSMRHADLKTTQTYITERRKRHNHTGWLLGV